VASLWGWPVFGWGTLGQNGGRYPEMKVYMERRASSTVARSL
jgi:hypothetical protein